MNTQRSSLNWPLILGLASLVLLHPLVHLTGLSNTMSSGAVPLVLLALTAVAWIGVVGFSSVRKPVLTLVLTGLISGVLTALLGALFGDGQAAAPVAWIYLAVIANGTFWGWIAGLLARLIQRGRGVRGAGGATPASRPEGPTHTTPGA